MCSDGSVTRTDYGEGDDIPELRDIHPLTPSSHVSGNHRRDLWEEGGSLSSIRSTMTRELDAMVVSGSNAQQNGSSQYGNESSNGSGEEPGEETTVAENNPLAIVPTDPQIPSPGHQSPHAGAGEVDEGAGEERLPPVHVVRREEVESKVAAWQTAEAAKINNRYKREEVIINGWESEQVEKAAAWLKKFERKLDKQKARATETMRNEIAKAQQKAAEKKASAEAKRGTKVARVLELANFMRAVGRAPSKRSFF